MRSSDFKDFWDKKQDPSHAHSSSAWFDRYAEEIMSYIAGAKSVVDAGCGSGELLERIGKHCSNVIGIDYSQSMLDMARKRLSESGLNNVELFCDSVTAIDKYCQKKVDAVYSNGVVQYLSSDELEEFMKGCRTVLNPGGRVALLSVPNINCRTLFLLGFYKHEEPIAFSRFLKGLPGLWWKTFSYRLRHGRRFDDGIGNWFSIQQVKQMAERHSFNVAIYGTSIVRYNYRFHAILTMQE
jgi:ubiquinone/menaquinone biosynthesis C-methylase UbiE